MPSEDTHFVVRCRYCAFGRDFRPLTARADGRYVCEQCGHTASPKELMYVCSCRQCFRLSRAAVRLENRWPR